MLFAVAGIDDAATQQFSRDSLPEDRCVSPPACNADSTAYIGSQTRTQACYCVRFRWPPAAARPPRLLVRGRLGLSQKLRRPLLH